MRVSALVRWLSMASEEEAAVRGRREIAEAVATLGEMSETRSALLRLRKLLLEGYEPPESEGESP